ncbi:MAG: hypothetical protein GX600_03425 [Dehalococcoidia bacterium]|nr:hypothetical protein [Dehalococcoidia bacterium]
MDSYNLHIKGTQQQFEAELRDTIQALPIPNKNTWFGVETSTLPHPDVVSILMVVWYPGEYQDSPKEMLGFKSDAEGNPLGELYLQRVDVGPQTRMEQVPSAIRCRCFQHGSEDLRVNIECVDERASTFCKRLVQELARHWPGAWQDTPTAQPTDAAAEPEERGPKVGTFERVREAHRLMTKRPFMTRTQAFKKAKIDSRTYDQWCLEATGEEPIEPYRD